MQLSFAVVSSLILTKPIIYENVDVYTGGGLTAPKPKILDRGKNYTLL